jgi:hypothetical protein
MGLTTRQVIEHFKMTMLPVESTYFVKTYECQTSRPTVHVRAVPLSLFTPTIPEVVPSFIDSNMKKFAHRV